MSRREDISVDMKEARKGGAASGADSGADSEPAPKSAGRGGSKLPGKRKARPMSWLSSASRKGFRLTAYLFFVSLVGATLVARSGYARIRGSAMSLGEELVRLTESTNGNDFYRLRMNGELMNVTSAKTSMPFRDVLARFKAACMERSDGMPEEFAHLKEVLKPDAPAYAQGSPGLGVFREVSEDRGMVLCFAQGGPTDYTAALGRMSEFAQTGDLGKVGDLRYVFARQTVGGSHVVAAWTEGSFPLGKMFPQEGDAPGTDVANAVRPDGTRRLFSAYAEGVPYGVRVYEADQPPSLVLGMYDREMPTKGWETITPVGERLPSTRAFSREGVDLILSVARHQSEPDKSVISIVEMRSQ